jgi:hypothetical protein
VSVYSHGPEGTNITIQEPPRPAPSPTHSMRLFLLICCKAAADTRISTRHTPLAEHGSRLREQFSRLSLRGARQAHAPHTPPLEPKKEKGARGLARLGIGKGKAAQAGTAVRRTSLEPPPAAGTPPSPGSGPGPSQALRHESSPSPSPLCTPRGGGGPVNYTARDENEKEALGPTPQPAAGPEDAASGGSGFVRKTFRRLSGRRRTSPGGADAHAQSGM